MSHTDTAPGHIIEAIDVTKGVPHNALIPVLIVPAVIPHTTDGPHTGPHQLTLRTTADHIPIQHTNQVRKPCINLQHVPPEIKTSHMIKEIQAVMIDDPQMDFYSSDVNSNDSKDDLDHLN